MQRHDVVTHDTILTLRVDESLYFANARYLEDRVYDMVAQRPKVKHVILMCPAVNEIDMSALESLEAINARLKELGVQFHFSEVKGPVMDRLRRCDFFHHLNGRIFLSQHQAVCTLTGQSTSGTAAKDAPSIGAVNGSVASKRASTDNISAASSTLRAIGPWTPNVV